MVPTNTGIFCAVENYAEKAELSKCSWYPKRKFGVTMHFSEIMKLQFGKNKSKKTPYIALYFTVLFCFVVVFKNNCCLISSCYPLIFFLDSNSHTKICFSSINCAKIVLYQEALSLIIHSLTNCKEQRKISLRTFITQLA